LINFSQSIIEEKKREHISRPPQDKAKLNAQLKLINTRLIIQSPAATRSDSYRLLKTEPNEVTSPGRVNSGKTASTKEELDQTSFLNKTKIDTSIFHQQKSPEPESRPQTSNLLKTRASLKKLTLTSKPKINNLETVSHRPNLTVQTPKLIENLRSEKSELLEGGSPRISSK